MRSMWKGSLSFGLVNVPVKMYTATEDHDVRFHQVHAMDGGRIRMQRKCSECGEVVPYSDIGKGFETATGERLTFTEEDFEKLPVQGTREIEVLEFVPSDQVDPVLFDKSYYLEPEERAVKPYVLLREALEETDRMAIVKITIRTRQQLAALRVRGEVLLLQTMLWPDEVRAAEFDSLAEDIEVRPQELQMAASLIGNLSRDFSPTEYHDEYREALLGVIDGKLEQGEGVLPASSPAAIGDDGQVLDLMAALQASVERSRAARGASTPPAGEATAEEAAATASAPEEASTEAATTNQPTPRAPSARKAPAKRAAAKATKNSADEQPQNLDEKPSPARKRAAS